MPRIHVPYGSVDTSWHEMTRTFWDKGWHDLTRNATKCWLEMTHTFWDSGTAWRETQFHLANDDTGTDVTLCTRSLYWMENLPQLETITSGVYISSCQLVSNEHSFQFPMQSSQTVFSNGNLRNSSSGLTLSTTWFDRSVATIKFPQAIYVL